MTPEGKVKAAVQAALAQHHVYPYIHADRHTRVDGVYFMPVPGVMSVPGVHDFVGVWFGVGWTIETKAPGNPSDATAQQEDFQIAWTRGGGISMTGVRSASAVDDLAAAVAAVRASWIPPAPPQIRRP